VTAQSVGHCVASSAVLLSRFFGFFQAIWGRHSVVPQRNRSLRLETAGWGSRDLIIRFGWHVQWVKITRIKLTRPSPRLVYHCNDATSLIQEGRCTQARSLPGRDGEDSDRPASERLHQWLEPSKQPNVAPFGQRGHWWRKRGPKPVCDGGVTAQK